jgi:DNA-binding CsgD family transcriptional regulator
MNKDDWIATKRSLSGKLSDEELRIVDMLIDGKTQPEIGRVLGQHRSMVWRKTQRIKKRLTE